ncbi:MAG: alginate export family protein [Deltaproteobacteria bacterium]|nr:alginate export family protein [Deltaproteobacteria bacterium]
MINPLACLIRIACVACCVATSTAAFAEDVPTKKIELGGELRLRGETLVNLNSFMPGRTAVEDDAFVLLRARIHLDAKPIAGLRVFIQPQFSRTFAQEESTIANGTALDDLDLHQAFLDLPAIGGSPLSLRLGRQEFAYGDGRLVGDFGWSNIGRSFDAVKATLKFDHAWVDGFASWIQRVGGNQYFGGLYGHVDLTDTLAEEPYALVLVDNDGGAGGGRLAVYTLGNRFVGTLGPWDFGIEAALQSGKSGGNTIFAYAGHGRGGYTFDTGWKPRLGVEYSLASGDSSPGVGRVTTFNNLFPTNHDKYGYMDVVGWRNIHDASASFQCVPFKNFTTSLQYHAFLLAQPADGLYQASGAQVRAGAAGASRFVGHEVDLLAKYKLNQYANFLVGYSYFRAGKFLADTGTKRDAHFAYAQTQVSF